jgi:hypothetical protein
MTNPVSEVTSLPDGFRRIAPRPDPVRWTSLRQRLSQAATRQGQAVQDGLALFRSWEGVGALIPSVLPAAALRGGEASRRALQRFLRTLGARRATVDELDAAPRGAAARVVGRVVGPVWKPFSHIWAKSEMTRDNVRLLVEEGHDFFLGDAPERAVMVQAAGGYLIGGPDAAIDPGDQVEVFGFVDHVIDLAAPLGGSRPRGEPITLALRAGDDLPLIVRKIPDTPKSDQGGYD